jgi:hypothetical protein
MLTKNKSFDCVEMKRKAQDKLHAEYESRKDEFSSYYAFLEGRAKESPWQQEFWRRVANAQTKIGK